MGLLTYGKAEILGSNLQLKLAIAHLLFTRYQHRSVILRFAELIQFLFYKSGHFK